MFLYSYQIAIIVIGCFVCGCLFVLLSYFVSLLVREHFKEKRRFINRVSELENRLYDFERVSSSNIHEIVSQVIKLNKEVFKNGKDCN